MLKVIKAQVVMKMTKLEELIKELCPNGVEYRKLSEIVKMSRGVRVVRSQLTDDGSLSRIPKQHDSVRILL